MRRCPSCGELVEKRLLLCPSCRSPIVSLEPFGRRWRVRLAFGIVLAAVGVFVWLVVRLFTDLHAHH